MKQRDTQAYLGDIEAAGTLISEFLAGKTIDDYESNALLRSAVERQFEIIGEALRQATTYDPALRERLPDAARIIAFRNQLIHGYSAVRNDVVCRSQPASSLVSSTSRSANDESPAQRTAHNGRGSFGRGNDRCLCLYAGALRMTGAPVDRDPSRA